MQPDLSDQSARATDPSLPPHPPPVHTHSPPTPTGGPSSLTVPDPPNLKGNMTFEQRGSRQCGDGSHPLLQLQSWRVFDMLRFPRCIVIPKRRETEYC